MDWKKHLENMDPMILRGCKNYHKGGKKIQFL